MPQTHYRTCNLCEAMCGLEISHEGNQVLTIKGDKQDPFSRGHICPKAVALKDIYEDPDRLKTPMKRLENGEWAAISWADAFDEVETNIKAIQDKHGVDALALYQGNPNVHNVGSMLFGIELIRALKTKNRFSATFVDQVTHHFASYHLYGHTMLLPVPDIDRTDYMLILGANPLASNGSMMTVPDVANRLKAVQKRGGKIVVIDPRRSETAKKADEHIFIKPGYDILLLLALVHTIFQEGLTDLGRLGKMTRGIAEVQASVKGFNAEKIAPIIGIPADKIRQLAIEFAQAPSAVCYGRMGVSVQEFGGLCQWLVQVLNIITGNLDKAGGAMFPSPAFDIVGKGPKKNRINRWKSKVRELPEFMGELPTVALAEDILDEGEGQQIKALMTIAGNPVLSTPNGTQLEKALEKLDYIVAVDIYLNETTKYANIILPPTTGLETAHYDVVFHHLAVRNTAKYSEILFDKNPEQRHDWEILGELTRRFRRTGGIMDKMKDSLLTPDRMIDFKIQTGDYGSKIPGRGLSLSKIRKDPHGIDLGALKSCLPQRLITPSGNIELDHDCFLNDIERVRQKWFNTKESTGTENTLLLIGRRHLRSNNSWMHNSLRLVKGRNRCTLMIHPKDASKYGVENGEMVAVKSRVGQVEIEAQITEEMMPGVVSIPHGWGHNRKGTKWRTAEAHAGASVNDLTDDLMIDEMTGNAAVNGVPVEVFALSEV